MVIRCFVENVVVSRDNRLLITHRWLMNEAAVVVVDDVLPLLASSAEAPYISSRGNCTPTTTTADAPRRHDIRILTPIVDLG